MSPPAGESAGSGRQRELLGLNRWDTTTPDSLAADIARGEALGYSHALLGTNSLRLWDTYVLLALAARQTRSKIGRAHV